MQQSNIYFVIGVKEGKREINDVHQYSSTAYRQVSRK
jgi:hypothetical protein